MAALGATAARPAPVALGGAPHAVVVGAGPAGCLAATVLARRGWRVSVFERREEPKLIKEETQDGADKKPQRTYPMVLNGRAMRALTREGLSLPIMGPGVQHHLAMYQSGKRMDMAGSKPEDRQYVVDRTALGREMYVAAREAGLTLGSPAASSAPSSSSSAPGITWHFGQNLAQVDFQGQVAVFESSNQQQGSGSKAAEGSSTGGSGQQQYISAQYDLLVGADGSGSAVRSALLAAMPPGAVAAEELFANQGTYKTYSGLRCRPAGEADKDASNQQAAPVEPFPGFTQDPPGAAIYFFSRKGHPNLAMWKRADSSISGMIVRVKTFDSAWLKSNLTEGYPQLPAEWIDSIVTQVSDASDQPPAAMGRIVKMSQLHGPRCVLLGDAGHPVTSSLGQGCNLALESVRVFASTLDSLAASSFTNSSSSSAQSSAAAAAGTATAVDVDALVQAYTKARLADVHAFQQLELSQAIMMGAPGVKPTSPLQRVSATALMAGSSALSAAAHRLAPQVFPGPVYIFGALRDADTPYTQVLRSVQLQSVAAVLLAASVLLGLGKAGAAGLGLLAAALQGVGQ